MLVVIAIIAVLGGLLLSALSKAKLKATLVPCLSNNRQIVQAWSMYAGDHEEELPPNVDGMDGQGVFTNWVAGTMLFPDEATNTALVMDVNKSLLAPYVGAASVFKCPADKTSKVRSVSMNNRMNPRRYGGMPVFTSGLGTNFMTFWKLSEILRPADIFVILEERSDTINDGYFAVDMSNTGTFSGEGVSFPYYIIDFPAGYHNGQGAIAFADGHTEAHQWVEATTTPPLGQATPRYTSATDRDLLWIQAHCTYPYNP